jgi:hypothetical protein
MWALNTDELISLIFEGSGQCCSSDGSHSSDPASISCQVTWAKWHWGYCGRVMSVFFPSIGPGVIRHPANDFILSRYWPLDPEVAWNGNASKLSSERASLQFLQGHRLSWSRFTWLSAVPAGNCRNCSLIQATSCPAPTCLRYVSWALDNIVT